MNRNAAAKFSPIVSDEKRIDVSLTDDQAVIKLSTWVEDLGWCGQKTITVDGEMLDDLHRVIAAARYKLNNKKIKSGEEVSGKKVLEFPVFD